MTPSPASRPPCARSAPFPRPCRCAPVAIAARFSWKPTAAPTCTTCCVPGRQPCRPSPPPAACAGRSTWIRWIGIEGRGARKWYGTVVAHGPGGPGDGWRGFRLPRPSGADKPHITAILRRSGRGSRIPAPKRQTAPKGRLSPTDPLDASRHEQTPHLLHGVGFDLADTLGGDAVFVGQFLQGGLVVLVQPAALHDVARPVIQLVHGGAQRLQAVFGLVGVS